MDFPGIVHFFLTYNEKIIEWSLITIILTIFVWMVASLFNKRFLSGIKGKEDSDLAEMKKMLNKIHQSLEEIKETQSLDMLLPELTEEEGGGEETSTFVKEDEKEPSHSKEKKPISDKNKKEEQENEKKEEKNIEKEEENIEKDKFKRKAEELEKKLEEYSMITEDISNLSKYKKENQELKEKLSKLSGNKVLEGEKNNKESKKPEEKKDLEQKISPNPKSQSNKPEPKEKTKETEQKTSKNKEVEVIEEKRGKSSPADNPAEKKETETKEKS